MPKTFRLRYSNLFGLVAAGCALALAAVTHVARADDIDAYSNPPGAGGRPNVMFIFDNTANWSATLNKSTTCVDPAANVAAGDQGTKFGAEKCALYRLIKSMEPVELAEFNIAFMFFNESPHSSGYPRQAFINVTTQTQKDTLLARIASWHINNDKGNNPATAEAFYEAWLWFRGERVHLGDKTVSKNDPGAFIDGTARTTYLSPGIGCAKNHIIYLANGTPNDNNIKAEELLRRINPSATRFAIPVTRGVGQTDEKNWADEFAAFFNRGADLSTDFEGQQTITVHTIAVTGAKSDGDFPNFVKWIAEMGGGLYQEARDADTIIGAVKDALNQIRASNSAFSAAALPASANTQGAYLNQVFIGMFRPDGNALQRWVGNLKQYQFKYDEIQNTLELADKNGNPAVSTVTGFISDGAISFWTEPSSFWINAETASAGKFKQSDSPDGQLVEKGGVAQRLRTTYTSQTGLQATRPVYTCIAGSCGGDVNLVDVVGNAYKFAKTNTALKTALQAHVGSNDDLLIDWIRGEENVTNTNVGDFNVAKDQLTSPPTTSPATYVRPSLHGDVLHSRPVALNYAGANETPRVIVYYGANDGMLRAINGNKTGTGAGSELWAFVAPEHFGTLNRLRENDPEVLYPSTPASVTTARKRNYYFDGPIGAFQNTTSGQVMIFATMRRGGRAVYAFNATDPEKPVLAWSINETTTDYTNLGQTWSTPRVALVKNLPTTPVLIMGGGFDNVAEDPASPTATTIGKGVYIINMTTGALLKYLDTEHSVPSDVSYLDTDGDGFVDRGYVVDVRANVYRIDMEQADGTALAPANWVITKLANFNDTSGKRRVFFAPDVVRTKNYTALMLGTGDREKPLTGTTCSSDSTTCTNDRFFIFKDRSVAKGAPTGVTVLTELDTTKVKPVGDDASKTDPDACYVQMAINGEKVINQPITFGGVTYFSSSRPSAGGQSCSTIISKAYQVPLICRAPTVTELVGDGLPPSPVVGYVEVGDGKVVPFVIGGPNTKKSAIEVGRPNLSIPGNRKRSYWFMQNRDR